jgi:hypothetical protein
MYTARGFVVFVADDIATAVSERVLILSAFSHKASE